MTSQLNEYLFKFESSYTALTLVLEATRHKPLSKEDTDEIWSMTENERNERMFLILSGLSSAQLVKVYEKAVQSLMEISQYVEVGGY